MDTLPSELLLAIVHKLAAQDPLALLTATCACKGISRVTEENSRVWKDIFYGSDSDQETEADGQIPDGMLKWSSNLDAKIESLGGFKQLLAARFAMKVATGSTSLVEQNPGTFLRRSFNTGTISDNGPLGSKDTFFEPNTVLILVRLQGSVVLWGLHSPAVNKLGIPASSGIINFSEIDIHLQPVFTTDHFVKALRKECATRGKSNCKKGLCGAMSLELLELQPSQPARGRPLTIARLWSGTLTFCTFLGGYEAIEFYLHGQLLPTYPAGASGLSTKALSAFVNLGSRPTSLAEKQRWRHEIIDHESKEGGSDFCCSSCASDWALGKLNFRVELRPMVAY